MDELEVDFVGCRHVINGRISKVIVGRITSLRDLILVVDIARTTGTILIQCIEFTSFIDLVWNFRQETTEGQSLIRPSFGGVGRILCFHKLVIVLKIMR
jgi:hypothetical protein